MKAEEADFPGVKFDLITVAQAIHWFDFDKFYQSVKGYLQPEGIIAIIGYDLLHIDLECDKAIDHLYTDILGKYWHPERRYIDAHYQTIPFPFKEIETAEFAQKAVWTLDHLYGYLNTWSALGNYMKQHGKNPLEIAKEQIAAAWDKDETKEVTFPLFMRLGRL